MTPREKELYWLNYAKQNAKMERLAFNVMRKAIVSTLDPIISSLQREGLAQTLSMLDALFPKLIIQEAYSNAYLEVGTRQKKWSDADHLSRFGKRKALTLELQLKEEDDRTNRPRRRPNPVNISAPETPYFNVGFFNPLWLARLRNLINGSEVGQRVSSVSKTVREKIRQSLSESSQQFVTISKTISKLRRDVGGLFSRQRAELIARTEVTYVSNLAQEESATEIAQAVGITLVKSWVATMDSRTRDAHRAVGSRKPIKKEEKFNVGGVFMNQPGDPAGGLKNCINCRCVVAYWPADDYEDLF